MAFSGSLPPLQWTGRAVVPGRQPRPELMPPLGGLPSSSGPLVVDQVVLDCCNEAFEFARVNRAAEVDVVHLIYAMCGVEPAAAQLAARGLRIVELRLEASRIISGTNVVSFVASPRCSLELSTLLQMAGIVAARAGFAFITVDHLVTAILEGKGGAAAQALLGQAAVSPTTSGLERLAPPEQPRRDFDPASERRFAAIESSLAALARQVGADRDRILQQIEILQRSIDIRHAVPAGLEMLANDPDYSDSDGIR